MKRIRSAQASGAYEPTVPYALFSSHHDDAPFTRTPTPNPLPIGGLLLLGGGTIGLLAYALRERPPKCPTCQQPMRLIDEQADDAYPNELQRAEEQLGSVNYLVGRCDACDTLEIFRKVALLNTYGRCPQCGGMTVRETARIVRTPTYTRTGLELIPNQPHAPAAGLPACRGATAIKTGRVDPALPTLLSQNASAVPFRQPKNQSRNALSAASIRPTATFVPNGVR